MCCCQVRLVIMCNVFPTDIRLHRKYDLKGSTYGRTAGPEALSDRTAVLKVNPGLLISRLLVFPTDYGFSFQLLFFRLTTALVSHCWFFSD
jgi:hypothetical protein